MKLVVQGVEKRYATRQGGLAALASVDLDLADREFVSIVGPSGCGKSTLLHIIGGLERATAGRVELDGEAVQSPGAEIGLVFQRQTLFPWLSIWQNVRFPCTLRRHRLEAARGEDRHHREMWIEQLMRAIGLWEFRDYHPNQLSGGMQQRAAIARALVARPDLLLMDEPFGALDAQTREEMQELLLHLNRLHRTSTLFVTHDVDEALLLSDRVLVFSRRPGRIQKEIVVPFAADLRTATLKLDPEFILLKRLVLKELHHAPSVERESFFLGQPGPER
jgi:NitT/TauT family transport system ATP-binding protein